MTDTRKVASLEQVPCIRYLVQFCQKNNKDVDKDVRALIELSNEVSAMQLIYTTKLGPYTRKTDVGV